jgi:general secretion pathway protein L
MSEAHTSARFFGLDVSSLRRDLLTAWQQMLNWPALAWLWPKSAVRLMLPSGMAVLSHGPGTAQTDNPKRTQSARFEAVQLPERLLLRNTLQVPPLQPHELHAALSLQVSSLSPFVSNDLVWAYELEPSSADAGGMLAAHLVIASRKLIAQYMAQDHAPVDPEKAEVWVPRTAGQGDLVLPGFGEAARARHSIIWRWVSAFLVAVALALVGAIALTPSAQLYLRAEQARAAMAALQQKAAPIVKQRESLTHTTGQLNNLAEIVGKPLPPLQVLKTITDALPDDTSLLTLQVTGPKVNISGQTVNAAALMKQLGATPGLRDVTAPTPATKPLGSPREQFTIEFVLDSTPPVAAK